MVTTLHSTPAAAPSPGTAAASPERAIAPAAGATRDGTSRYAKRFAARFTNDFFRPLASRDGMPPLAVGSIGVGTYLGPCTDAEDARYEAALHAALGSGCNVVDTAINYRCQRSERAVGRALATAIAAGIVQRDEVVVCTKGGFVALDGAPPPTREAYDAYLERELFARGVLRTDDLVHGGHSLAPSFLAHQIARSRENLGVDTIDVYYLHEPERQLDVLAPDAFAVALRRAIEVLEAAVERREIGRWGIASWRGLRVAPGLKGHLALGAAVDAARDVAGDRHHLGVVQLPINLAMPEAVRAHTQPVPTRGGELRTVSALQAAHAHGLSVVASSPLMEGQLASGLPTPVREQFRGCQTDAQCAVSFVRGLPGVCTTLVGMRTATHLRENLRIAR
jgi:aryl-alcohol dehydrogenase-like predicted oxidoreductase